ncbi:MAG: phage holin family protein [Actinomycetaceae bacterium]|nr:phage holin family protein [Actinomycetaceae bacterium]MDY6083506.1 phage holin family protein [Actinomycetaceae bacterium]
MESMDGQQTTIGMLINKASQQISTLVRGEFDFAQANLKAKVKKLGLGGVLLAVVVVLGVFLLNLLLFAAVAGFAVIVPWWAAFLIVSAIVLVVMAVLALIGVAKIKASSQHKVNPKEGFQKDAEAVKSGIQASRAQDIADSLRESVQDQTGAPFTGVTFAEPANFSTVEDGESNE